MDVTVQLKETSQPVVSFRAANTYTKGPLYCIQIGEKVYKYPLVDIWRVVEDYGEHT